MLSFRINTHIPLDSLSCGDITFGIYKDSKGITSPILFIKDREKIISSFSNSIGFRLGVVNIQSVRVVLIAVKIND